MEFMAFLGKIAIEKSSKGSNNGRIDEGMKNEKQQFVDLDTWQIVDLDSWELPSLNNEEEEGKIKAGIESFVSRYEEASRQYLVPKSILREESKPFHEVLAYWRSKEKGEIEEKEEAFEMHIDL
ncbi:hypothetical protein JCGZ_11785 [Jatropha curcas]|uniref:Uncharacterized protein n=2 Tax=Jatropha curcas TaxID=180498 RepID=A0A067KHT8_JATCU|nr:uncharacterized protein LOC110010198 isoform X2 [Jatropha curcas]KDP31409.1 hypothetical protein JCGZ_11785 [Jatropha curcas]